MQCIIILKPVVIGPIVVVNQNKIYFYKIILFYLHHIDVEILNFAYLYGMEFLKKMYMLHSLPIYWLHLFR